jgi:ATP-binding cassette subfamily F protein 3
MLQLRDLSLRRGPRLLFEGASFNVHPGWKAGVTGANGTGKSSLFALVRGELHADAGDVDVPSGWVIAHVAQQTPSGQRPAIEYVLDGDVELRAVEADLATAEAAHQGTRAAELHGRLEAIGGYEARARAARLLHGLGFAPGEEHRAVDRFSGGWRMRLNLARALMCRSDLLLLDEPTNHLDLDAVIWLEAWLRRYAGTLLLISHDRDFMDAVIDHVVHIEQQRATLYTGNYSAFERTRAERLARQQAEHERQQREIAHIHSFVERFRAKATKARQAQSRLKALERMEQIAPAHVDSPFHFAFRDPRRLPRPLLRVDEGAAGYGSRPVLAGLRMTLSPGDRLGLLGPNGAGKSTLIKLLAGDLPLLEGREERAADLAVGYFAQHQLDQLHPEHSPLEHLAQLDRQAAEQSLRDYLGGFGFQGDRALEPVAPLSGGEKARLALALLVYRRPNLLLLDEPTNHLDLEMRLALGQALQEFAGAMVIVSHDRHLLRITTDELLLVHGGGVEPFEGSLDDYPAWLQARNRPEPVERPAAQAAPSRKDRKRLEAERRRMLQPMRDQARSLESEVERLTREQTALETRLADPALYAAEAKEALKAALGQKSEVDRALEEAEERWLDALEALEEAAGAARTDGGG